LYKKDRFEAGKEDNVGFHLVLTVQAWKVSDLNRIFTSTTAFYARPTVPAIERESD